MEKIIRKIISTILYLLLMYFAYNLFMPEQGFLKKSEKFTNKQANIIKYENLVSDAATVKDSAGYHLLKPVDDKARVSHSCETCHTNYPHKEKKETRAFYNMHSFKISCLACHIDEKNRQLVKLGWFDRNENFKKKRNKSLNIRITPYLVIKGLETVLESGIEDHDALNEKYNVGISKRSGLQCKACHTKKGKLFLDLEPLGYTMDEIKTLRSLDEATMHSRKENWRYPDFL